MVITTDAPVPATAPEPAPRVAVTDPWPRRVFVAGLVVAAPALLWVGREHWFFLDEWLVLQRGGLTAPGWFDAHNGHWITVVELAFRANFRLWGLRTYLPYQVPVVAAHLACAVMLRVAMLRVGVRPWLATGAALLFVVFGSGRDNITFGFQISLTGSLLAGLALLLIADRPGPPSRADGWGLAVAVVGLMTSSVFLALLVGVGVAVLIRRGLRVALVYAIPLGVVYGAWYLRYGAGEGDPMHLTGNTVRFAGRMVGAVFSSLTAVGILGVAVALTAAVGVGAAVLRARRTGDRRAASLLLGLAVGWLVFAGLTSLGRAESPITALHHGASRYVHIGAALVLPAVAAGIERLLRWRTAAGVLAGLVLVVGVPRNVDRLVHTDPLFLSGIDLFGGDSRAMIEALAHSPWVDDVPAGHVLPTIEPRLQLTAGWLATHGADGRIARPAGPAPENEQRAANLLVLDQVAPSPASTCRSSGAGPGEVVTVARGDEMRFEGLVALAVVGDDDAGVSRRFRSREPSVVRALAGPVDVAVHSGEVTAVCRTWPTG